MRYSIDQDNSAWRVVDGEAVLINAETTFYYGLNSTATRIWRFLLEDDLTVEEIADRIAPEFGKNPPEITESVKDLLDELTIENLLTTIETDAPGRVSRSDHRGIGDEESISVEWENPRLTRYDTLEELVVCGE